MRHFNFLRLLAVSASLIFMLNGCKKETNVDNSVAASDANNISASVDGISDDASAAAGQVSNFSGKTSAWAPALSCSNAVADSGTGQTITITYNGALSCSGFYRSGAVTITLLGATKWSQQNAQINVSFTNMKITTLLGTAYTLTGTYIITNETGGLAWQVVAGLVNNTTVQHRVTAQNVTVTFADGSQRQWMVDRSTSYTSVSSGATNTITTKIFTESSTGHDTQGTNRYGQSFTTTIADTIEADNNLLCLYRPFGGKYVYQVGNVTASITFGTNSSGVPDGSPTSCGQGYDISYTNGGSTLTAFILYW